MDRLLTYEEAANYLAVGKSTLYAMVSRGDIPIVEFGGTGKGCTRFLKDDLEAFVGARRHRRNRPKRPCRPRPGFREELGKNEKQRVT